MLRGQPLIAQAFGRAPPGLGRRPGSCLRWRAVLCGRAVLLGVLLLAWGSCGEDPAPSAGSGSAPAPERLHAPGELRLTSAGKAPRIPLRYRLAPGMQQTYRTQVTLVHRAVGATANLGTELDWERSVTEAVTGGARVQMKVLRVRRVTPSSLRDGLGPKLQGLLLTATLDPRGRVSALTPPEALSAPGGEAVFSRFTAPLPEDAVGEGAAWERLEPWDLTLPRTHQGVRLGVRTRYRLGFVLVRGEPRRARITAELRFHVVHTTPIEKAPTQVTGGGKGSAEWELDLLRGEPLASRSELDLDLQVTSHGRTQRLEQRLQSRTHPVRPPPSPRGAAPTKRPRSAEPRATPGGAAVRTRPRGAR